MLSEKMLAKVQRYNPKRLVVGYSGGLDSHVLLHVASTLAVPVHGLHINHGLQAQSSEWERHTARVCANLEIAFTSIAVTVSTAGSIEENARDARYRAFESFLVPGDLLLLAHHADDQIETALMNLFRGNARPGIGGMPVEREIGQANLLRPLLDQSRSDLHEYANRHQLQWIEDASNQDTGYSRNHIRHEIIPVVEKRWPGARRALLHAIERDEEALQLIDYIGKNDLDAVLAGGKGASIERLWALPDIRRRNAVRYWIASHELPMPSEAMLESELGAMKEARHDSAPLLTWQNVCLRRHGEHIYLTDSIPDSLPLHREYRLSVQTLEQDPVLDFEHGQMTTDFIKGRGIKVLSLDQFTIRFREGGEKIFLGAHKTLKNVLQESGVPVWLRGLVPLLYVGSELVGIAGLPDWGVPMVIAGAYAAREDESGVEFSFRKPNHPYSH